MFHKRLKDLRKSKGLTGEELAKAIGISKTTISRYENAVRNNPTLPVLEKLSIYFNVSIDYLTGKTDDKNIHIPDSTVLRLFDSLNVESKTAAINYIKYLKHAEEEHGGDN